jgi:hypothetical protein
MKRKRRLGGPLIYAIGPLERRTLLSVPIYCSPGDDTLVVNVQSDNRIFIIYNGNSEVLPAPTGGNVIDIYGDAGNDDIWIQNTNDCEINVYDTDGADTYRVGSGEIESDIQHNVSIYDSSTNAGTKVDQLTVEDGVGNSNGTGLRFDGTKFELLASIHQANIVFTLGGEDSVTYNGTTADDRMYIEGMRPNVTFNMGDGNDTIDLGGFSHRCDYFVPPSVSITLSGGSGNDKLIADDSNPSSILGTMRLDAARTLDAMTTDTFEELSVKTHTLPGGAAERVLFTGTLAPAYRVTVTGAAGDDNIEIGSVSDRLHLLGTYCDDIDLQLSTGINKVAVNEDLTDAGHGWAVQGSLLESGSLLSIHAYTFTDITIRGTAGDDSLLINTIDPDWKLTFDGQAGNDTLTHSGGDIDASFTGAGPLTFDGSSGANSVQLYDYNDQIGDVDGYTVSDFAFSKGDFGSTQTTYLALSNVSQFSVVCDNDPNVIRFPDLSSFTACTIDGGDGNDTFTDVSAGATGANMNNLFGTLATLIGGAGSDTMALDDKFGTSGQYALSATDFAFTITGVTHHVQFSTFETITLDGSDQSNVVQVNGRPAGATVAVNGAGGDDSFYVGGGDIDTNGLTTAAFTVTGGLGNDSITFDDTQDDISLGESEIYNIETLTLTKGSAGVSYSGFETQTLNVARKNSPASVNPQTVNINSPNSSFTSTTINGGGSRATIVNMGNPFLNNIPGTVTVNGGGANMTVNYSDAVNTLDRQYLINATQVYRNIPAQALLNYSNVTTLNVNAGSGNDQILIEGIPAGTTVNAHGNDGNDLIVFGNFGSFFSTMLGNGNAFGDAGTDEVRWASFDSAAINATLTTSALTHLTHVYSYSGFEKLWVNFFNTAALTLGIQSLNLPASVTGGNGPDVVSIGGGDLYDNIHAGATINGSNGDDVVIFDDTAAVAPGQYLLDAGDVFTYEPVGGALYYSFDSDNMEHMSIKGGNYSDYFSITANGLDLSLSGNGGDDVMSVRDSSTTVYVDTGSEAGTALIYPGDAIYVNTDATDSGDTGASVRLAGTDKVSACAVFSSGSSSGLMRIPTNATLAISDLFSLSGTIDVSGSLLLRSTAGAPTPAQLRSALVAGRNNGAWNGASASGAINSSTAAASSTLDGIGYGLGSQIAISSIGGFNIAPGDTLFRYTLEGDANLNGAVNAADLGVLSLNWQGNSKVFSQADFNYDNKVDLWDLYGLSKNFNQTLPPAPAAPVALPLPARAPQRTATRVSGLINL